MHDPYRGCEKDCTHDLARGVLVSELLCGDGTGSQIHYTLHESVLEEMRGVMTADSLRGEIPPGDQTPPLT